MRSSSRPTQRWRARPLSELKTLATRVGLAYEMAMRPAGADFLVPSVIHWRVDHYSAVVRKEGNRYLLLDPIFGGRRWVSAAMLNDEASGYVLAPTAMLGPEWRRVSASEAANVTGHCFPGGPDDNDPRDCGVGGGAATSGWRFTTAVDASEPARDRPAVDVYARHRPAGGLPPDLQPARGRTAANPFATAISARNGRSTGCRR